MVARISELPAPWLAGALIAPDWSTEKSRYVPARVEKTFGELLTERASDLAGVAAGGRGISGFSGVPLRMEEEYRRHLNNFFLRGSVFAVIADDGAMCLRVPDPIAEDLIDNGLAIRAGKHLLTWPVQSYDGLNTNWNILLTLYGHISGAFDKRSRRMWSEWVTQY